MINRGNVVFGLLAIVLTVVFARLGVWQLDRRSQRLETNALRASRAAMPPLRLAASPPESDVFHIPTADSVVWRRIRVAGRFDAEREIILRSRSRDGRPGVELLTPLVVGSSPQTDQAILVLRGWLPARDGLRPRLSDAWPAGSTDSSAREVVEVEGIAVPGSDWAASPPIRLEIDGEERAVLGAANLQIAQDFLPYPVAGFYLRATVVGATGPGLAPPREPELGEGPHLSYALQWFSFAIIALVGTGIYLRKEGGR